MARTLRERLLATSPKAHAMLISDPQVFENLPKQAAEHRIAVDEALLAEVVGQALEKGLSPAELHMGDLYLAAACAAGHPDALRRFAAVYSPDLERAIARSPGLGLSPSEFRQLAMDRLFVAAADRPPKIRQYAGRGTLQAWLRVMTSRLVIDLSRRRRGVPQSAGDLSEGLRADQDTEIDYLRRVYGSALQAGFEEAVRCLSVRQRNLLRQRYLHEISGDALAKMYGVHRSTMFAWLEQARATLLRHVRGVLARRIPGDELDSVIGLLGSQLQLSVRRMLDSQLETDAP